MLSIVIHVARAFIGLLAVVILPALATSVTAHTGKQVDSTAETWVNRTLETMSLDEQIGQLIMPSFFGTYTSSDSDVYDELVRFVREYHVGGFLVFGCLLYTSPSPRDRG